MGISYQPTVPLSMLRGLCGLVEHSGVSRAFVLEAAGIQAADFGDPDARLARSKFEELCELAMDRTGNDALGLQWAELLLERSFGPASDELLHVFTLRQAFGLLARFEAFFTRDATFEVLERAGSVVVRVPTISGRPLRVRRFFAEVGIAWHVKLVRTIGSDAPLDWVAFAHDAPPYQAAYQALFNSEIRFGQPFTELGFPRAWLDLPRSLDELGAEGREQVPVDPADSPTSCSARLLDLLVQRAPGRVSMPEAARRLGIGERSLRRRLAAEGHTFKRLEFRALATVAKQKLYHEQRSIDETASQMGFAAPSSFYRAFKRWTGATPRSFQPVHADGGMS